MLNFGTVPVGHSGLVFFSHDACERNDMTSVAARYHPATETVAILENTKEGDKLAALIKLGAIRAEHLVKNKRGNFYVNMYAKLNENNDEDNEENNENEVTESTQVNENTNDNEYYDVLEYLKWDTSYYHRGE